MKYLLILISIFCVAFEQTAWAHHGKDFLVASSCETPHEGLLCAHLNTQFYAKDNSSEPFTLFSPGIIYGFSDKLGLELHSHFNKSQSSFHLEALALEARYSFLSEKDDDMKSDETPNPFSLSASLEFEQGVIKHPNVLESRFIIGKEFGFITLIGNLIFMQEFEEGQHPEARFVLGIKSNITKNIRALVEVLNNDHHTEGTQLSLGCSVALMNRVDLTLGAGFATMNHKTMLSSFQSMLMYSF